MALYTVFTAHFKPFYNKTHLKLAIFNQSAILVCILTSFLIYLWLTVTIEKPEEKYILYALGSCSVLLILLSTLVAYPLAHAYIIYKQSTWCSRCKSKAKKGGIQMQDKGQKKADRSQFEQDGKIINVQSAYEEEEEKDVVNEQYVKTPDIVGAEQSQPEMTGAHLQQRLSDLE